MPRLRRRRRRFRRCRCRAARATCSGLLARREERHADQDRDHGDYIFLHRIISTTRRRESLVVLTQINCWQCACLVCMHNRNHVTDGKLCVYGFC